ncbi:MAG: N-acetyltransferase family protein [Pirellulales bacterium]
MHIEPADLSRLNPLAALFDAYRVFYEQPSDPDGSRRFLRERLTKADSCILCALGDRGEVLGFVQLYPTFSSVAMAPIFILNDLFVDPAARRHGVGRRLLEAARDHARASGARRLELATQKTNTTAQALYESAGWVKEEKFFRYLLPTAE